MIKIYFLAVLLIVVVLQVPYFYFKGYVEHWSWFFKIAVSALILGFSGCGYYAINKLKLMFIRISSIFLSILMVCLIFIVAFGISECSTRLCSELDKACSDDISTKISDEIPWYAGGLYIASIMLLISMISFFLVELIKKWIYLANEVPVAKVQTPLDESQSMIDYEEIPKTERNEVWTAEHSDKQQIAPGYKVTNIEEENNRNIEVLDLDVEVAQNRNSKPRRRTMITMKDFE
ncbi:unnamed protein product [Blepharisma stoltei]|uniref:Transmembrane protein n=1 Tax=Blepharisma stoltei TaxID=1481888 RepID=A0AAU9JJZ0_9CILI|nr:unnamed protein product [Blepharisma stoltei]